LTQVHDAAAAARTATATARASAAAALAEPWLCAAFHDPGYIAQAHHRLVSREILSWASTPNGRLIVSLPPQVGKSWTAVVWTSFWLLARDPTTRIIIACCTAELANYHGGQIRDRIDAYGEEHGLKLKRGSNRSNFFQTTEGGYVRTVGVGGMTTGFPATHFLMDDLFKDWVEAHSPTARERKWMWASSVARTRLQPGGVIAYVGTRWNEDDVPGRFMVHQPGRWRVVNLPAIATSEEDPLGRSIGEPLPRPGYDEADTAGLEAEWALAQAEQPVVVWEAMYQCDPHPPGGALIDADVLQTLECLNPTAKPVTRVVSVDPSVGKESASAGATGRQNTFGIISGWLGDDNRVYLVRDDTRVMAPEEGCEKTMQAAYDTQAGIVYVEGNQGGAAWQALMTGAWDRLAAAGRVSGPRPRVVMLTSRGDKSWRAQMAAAAMHHDQVRFAQKLPAVWREWTSWRPGDESPGRIDASGQLILKLLPEHSRMGLGAASPADSPLVHQGRASAFPWRG
jgi:hypothetical protein